MKTNKYSNILTSTHPLFKEYAIDLCELLQREGGKQISDDEHSDCKVIEMDRAKNKMAPTLKSVDIVFCCEGGKIQLSECKLRVKNINQLSSLELEGKVSDTKAILMNSSCTSTCGTQCALIVKETLVQSARNKIRRLYPTKSLSQLPFTVLAQKEYIDLFFKV